MESQRNHDLWVIKTPLAKRNQAFACRMALSGDSVQLISIDGYARFRAGCIHPLLFRVSPQTRSGSGRTSAATRRVQAEADPSQTAPPRSAVLDCAPPTGKEPVSSKTIASRLIGGQERTLCTRVVSCEYCVRNCEISHRLRSEEMPSGIAQK